MTSSSLERSPPSTPTSNVGTVPTKEKAAAQQAPTNSTSEAGVAQTPELAADQMENSAAVPSAPSAKDAPPSPRQAIAPAMSAVRHRAAGARKHSPPGRPVASAQAAAKDPQTERTREASKQTVERLDSAEAEKVRREQFKTKLKEAIEKATPKPKTESQAEKVMKTGGKDASRMMHGELATQRDAAAGPLQTAAGTEVSPAEQKTPPPTSLELEPVGPPPKPVSATAAICVEPS